MVVVVCAVFFGIVLVHGIKLNPSLAAPFHGFVQQFTLAHSPENQFVLVANEQLQGFGGKGALFANLGIAVFHYCAVEVYCYNHNLNGCLLKERMWSIVAVTSARFVFSKVYSFTDLSFGLP